MPSGSGGPCPNGVSTDRFEVVATGTDIGTMEYIISESCLLLSKSVMGGMDRHIVIREYEPADKEAVLSLIRANTRGTTIRR